MFREVHLAAERCAMKISMTSEVMCILSFPSIEPRSLASQSILKVCCTPHSSLGLANEHDVSFIRNFPNRIARQRTRQFFHDGVATNYACFRNVLLRRDKRDCSPAPG